MGIVTEWLFLDTADGSMRMFTARPSFRPPAGYNAKVIEGEHL